METNRIIQGDSLEVLKTLPKESVDMVMTSPPYWALRAYQTTPQIWGGTENCEHEWFEGKDAGDPRIEKKSENRAGWERPSRKNFSNRTIGNVCPICKIEFESKPQQKFCSIKCLNTLSNEERTDTPPISNFCLKCNAWKGELGLEPTIELFIKHLCDIFDEVKRVLKKEGTCWVNLADSYLGSNQGYGQKPGQGSGLQNTSEGYFSSSNAPSPLSGYKNQAKCMALIPERFVIEMCNRGWLLRNKICWYKRNSMPSSVKDRFCNKWEYVFLFSKSKKYYFNLDAVRKPQLPSSVNPINAGFSKATSFNYRVRETVKGTLSPKFGDRYSATDEEKAKYQNMSLEQAEALGSPRAREVRYKEKYSQLNDKAYQRKVLGVPHDEANTNPLGGNPGDHWDITNQPHKFCHFACYPERLCEVPIRAGCPEGGIVLDPFSGSGTTALVALKQGKKFLGIELNKSYCDIAEKRLKPYLEQQKL